MKRFGEFEQKIIDDIIETNKNGWRYSTYIYDLLAQEKCIYSSGKLICYKEGIKVSEFTLIEKRIIETALFFKFLEENRYVYFIRNENDPEPENKSSYNENQKNIKCNLPKEAIDVIENSLYKYCFVSRELEILKENNFKTYEEQILEETQEQSKKSKRVLVYSCIAIVIAFLTLLATIYMVYITRKC